MAGRFLLWGNEIAHICEYLSLWDSIRGGGFFEVFAAFLSVFSIVFVLYINTASLFLLQPCKASFKTWVSPTPGLLVFLLLGYLLLSCFLRGIFVLCSLYSFMAQLIQKASLSVTHSWVSLTDVHNILSGPPVKYASVTTKCYRHD